MQKRNQNKHWLHRVAVLSCGLALAGCLDFSGTGNGEASGQPVMVISGNSTPIKPLSASSIVSTIAGDPTRSTTVDGQGSAASFAYTEGIAIDNNGNLYIADQVGGVIRKVSLTGNATTFAGDGISLQSQIDGTGTSARFEYPTGIAVDSNNNIFVSDGGSTIRKISPAGVVSTFAGTEGQPGIPQVAADGQGTSARFEGIGHLTIDKQDNLYATDRSCIRKITPAATVSTVAGLCGTRSVIDGPSPTARFDSALGIAIDGNGTLFISEVNQKVIRKLSTQGIVTTIAGSVGQSGFTDGNGANAQFTSPEGLAIDSFGNLLVADTVADTIRIITPSGQVSTLSGAATPVSNPGVANGANSGNAGSVDGSAVNARFYFPVGLVFDNSGTLYITDRNNHTIRKITP